MSYLDPPRLHLFGRFFANPSTINNDTANYDPDQVLTPGSVGWNPPGIALFKVDVAVQSALGADGGGLGPGDALAGARLQSTGKPNHAKIVDLDPDQQNISQVFGLHVELTLADGTAAFSGAVDTSTLSDLWWRVGGNPGIEQGGGFFQTVIRVATWGDLSRSPFLQALKAKAGNTLSIKWNVDGYNGDRTDPGFGWGRMTATIGPAFLGEPVRRLARRWMLVPPTAPGVPVLWYAPFQVDETRGRLVVDLGNSIPTTRTRSGPPVKFASFAVVLDAYGAAVPVTPPGFALQDYATAYQQSAGVYEFPLTAEQLTLAATRPIGIRATGADGKTAYSLTEAKDGRMVVSDLPFVRLDPGGTEKVQFYARVFGAPDAGRVIPLALVNPLGAAGSNNLPPGGLGFPASVTTGPDGSAVATFTGGSTAPRAKWRAENDIDGQVYFVSGPWWPNRLNSAGNVPVSALVFDAYQPRTVPPTFWGDIHPMMYQYMRLYPGMRSIMDVSDYATLTQPPVSGAHDVAAVFSLPIEHPNYMPVTRDLSKAKREAFIAWVEAQFPLGEKPVAAPAPDTAAPVPATAEASSDAAPFHEFGPGANSIKSQP